MKIVIPGGSGQVGHLLARELAGAGHDVVVISRSGDAGAGRWRSTLWDGRTMGDWASELDGADVVINLAGRSVNCRYTPEHRREIMDSRVDSTRVVGEAIAASAQPPALWLQMSTATIYAHRFDAPNDEHSGRISTGPSGAPDAWRFSVDVARAWESALEEAPTPQTRRVALRSAMIMSPDAGGVFDTVLGLVRRGLGGRAGDGCQYTSWIHETDFVAAVGFIMAHEELRGAVNLASPEPLPNAEFMRELRHAWGARFGLPAAHWMLEIGALAMSTETELILKSRRVVPARLLESGFEFVYPHWRDAARELCERWRAQHRRSA